MQQDIKLGLRVQKKIKKLEMRSCNKLPPLHPTMPCTPHRKPLEMGEVRELKEELRVAATEQPSVDMSFEQK